MTVDVVVAVVGTSVLCVVAVAIGMSMDTGTQHRVRNRVADERRHLAVLRSELDEERRQIAAERRGLAEERRRHEKAGLRCPGCPYLRDS